MTFSIIWNYLLIFQWEQIVLLLLALFFLHTYKADFIADLEREPRLAAFCNLNFLYIDIDDVLSLNNPYFGDLIHRTYPQRIWDKGHYRHCKVSTISTLRSIVKENYWPNYSTNAMTLHSVLSIFLSSVATFLQHLRMDFSYYNSYVILFVSR